VFQHTNRDKPVESLSSDKNQEICPENNVMWQTLLAGVYLLDDDVLDDNAELGSHGDCIEERAFQQMVSSLVPV
jgi:hypothetical protein